MSWVWVFGEITVSHSNNSLNGHQIIIDNHQNDFIKMKFYDKCVWKNFCLLVKKKSNKKYLYEDKW